MRIRGRSPVLQVATRLDSGDGLAFINMCLSHSLAEDASLHYWLLSLANPPLCRERVALPCRPHVPELRSLSCTADPSKPIEKLLRSKAEASGLATASAERQAFSRALVNTPNMVFLHQNACFDRVVLPNPCAITMPVRCSGDREIKCGKSPRSLMLAVVCLSLRIVSSRPRMPFPFVSAFLVRHIHFGRSLPYWEAHCTLSAPAGMPSSSSSSAPVARACWRGSTSSRSKSSTMPSAGGSFCCMRGGRTCSRSCRFGVCI